MAEGKLDREGKEDKPVEERPLEPREKVVIDESGQARD